MKDKATEVARERYDRRAPTYDIMETFVERLCFGKWRRMLWGRVEGRNILEVGVGILLTPAIGAVFMSMSTLIVSVNSRFLKME